MFVEFLRLVIAHVIVLVNLNSVANGTGGFGMQALLLLIGQQF